MSVQRVGRRRCRRRQRAGVASIDYALLIGVVLPMAAFCVWVGPRLLRQVYEILLVCISWPFM